MRVPLGGKGAVDATHDPVRYTENAGAARGDERDAGGEVGGARPRCLRPEKGGGLAP